MELNRRSFLRGILTVAVATALPINRLIAQDALLPVLVGDGKHNDWAALQAFFNGKPFRTADGFGGTVIDGRISGGVFRCEWKLLLPKRQAKLVLERSQIIPYNGEMFFVDKMTLENGVVSAHGVHGGGHPYAS